VHSAKAGRQDCASLYLVLPCRRIREPAHTVARYLPECLSSRPQTMPHLEVLLFASYADAFGASAVTVAVPEIATVDDVVGALRALPGGGALPARPLVAVDRRYAPGPIPVRAGQEIALIPPVAGG